MTTEQYTQDAGQKLQRRTPDEIERLDRLKDADDLLAVFYNNRHGRQLPNAAEGLLTAGAHLVATDEGTQRAQGYLMSLDALLAVPDALQQAVQCLRQSLVQSHPDLAMTSSTLLPEVEQPVPLAVVYQVNGSDMTLDADGQLMGIGHKLSFDQVFTLLCFFRMPGVAALIDRLAIEDQTASELNWREAAKQEMSREQAHELLKTDVELQQRFVREALDVVWEQIRKKAAENRAAEEAAA